MQERDKFGNLALFVVALLVSCFAAQGQSLGRGHQTLLKWGLQIQPHTCPQLWTEDFDVDLWASAHFTAVDFGSGPTYPVDFMPPAPGLPWANIIYTGQLDPVEEPYADRLIRLSIRDEQDITDPSELAALVTVITSLHNRYPHVIVHTNQGSTSRTVQAMRNYMQRVQPDMLMFDAYPFGAVELSGISPTHFYEYLERYRKLGLEGNDGSGAQPIPTGVYLRTFYTPSLPNASIVSESEIRLQYFAAWAFGYKLVDDFIYDAKPDPNVIPILFDGPGTANPTPAFHQVAETNRQSLNLGPALVRLISTDVRMKMGQHRTGTFTVNNSLPGGVSSWNADADRYITNMTATNLGGKNHGLRGDVIVGYFKPLDASFTNPGHEDDVYFMIVNGLSDTGSALETRQQIRLDFDFGASGINSLQRLSRDTGLVETVGLVSDGGARYHLDLILDGGTGDLFKFNNGGTFVPEPTSLGLLIGSGLMIGGRAVAASKDRQPSDVLCGCEMTEEIRGGASQQNTDRR